jgi:16S rRNA (guanine527-N7)-methyltransferase
VDVGSGGGSPGLPVAAARGDLHVDLLDASRRRCDFLLTVTGEFPNVAVVCARAEEHGRGEGRDAYAVALARALAPLPVAAEWCLPLVRPGGIAVLYAGEGGGRLDHVADELGAAPPRSTSIPGSATRRLLVFRKLLPTPDRFPRKPGIARKRPLT